MGLLDRLKSYLNDDAGNSRGGYPGSGPVPPPRPTRTAARSEDEMAVDRYRYLLRTAPPEAVEEVHAEAFATLTPEQRRLVFEDLSQNAATADRPASDDPRTLARSATRSELRQPGFLERTLGTGGAGGAGGAGAPRGPGFGAMVGGSLLGTVAGVVIGSAIADLVLPGIGDFASDIGDGVGDMADGAGDFADGAGDFASDMGGGFGDLGGDFGGEF